MSRQTLPDFSVVVVAGILAAVGVVLICGALAAIAKPRQMNARIERLGDITRRIDALEGRPGDPAGFAPMSVCDAAGPEAGEGLKKQFGDLARLAGVSVSSLSVETLAPSARASLTPIRFDISVSGHYDADLLMLESMAKARPLMLVDAIDLKSQSSNVDLKVSGNIYCWTAAHL